jgi:hypothetical protein
LIKILDNKELSIYLWLYGPCGPWPLFQLLNLYTVGRTPWTGDQPVARPLHTRRTTQTQNKRTQTDIHVSRGIRTQDRNVRAGEDGSCVRQRGHCNRLNKELYSVLNRSFLSFPSSYSFIICPHNKSKLKTLSLCVAILGLCNYDFS